MLAPLAKVRHQILRLLGSLGGQTNMLLLGNKDIDPSKVVAWDTENHLTFAVPFQDMKPNIYLGRIKTGLCLCFLSFPPQIEGIRNSRGVGVKDCLLYYTRLFKFCSLINKLPLNIKISNATRIYLWKCSGTSAVGNGWCTVRVMPLLQSYFQRFYVVPGYYGLLQ